jgi:hypothetical protein
MKKMTKVVISRCFGGAGLSNEAFEALLKRKGIEYDVVVTQKFSFDKYSYYRKGHAGDDNYYLWDSDFLDNRSDPDLVAVVEEMGEAANGWAAELKVVEVPDDAEWFVDDYDGREWVAEKHRTWE